MIILWSNGSFLCLFLFCKGIEHFTTMLWQIVLVVNVVEPCCQICQNYYGDPDI